MERAEALEDINFVIPKDIDGVLNLIQRRIEVHQEWAYYLEENPRDPNVIKAIESGIGQSSTHRLYMQQYEAVLKIIQKTIKEPK